MKAVIPENLVSVYDITVPYAFDMRKLRQRLDAELEKLHPRFPDRCVADYRFHLEPYSRDGKLFHIRAVVMDRFQLAAIRKEKKGCMLYTGGMHPYPVFSRDVLKKRVLLAASALAVLTAVFLLAAVPRMNAESAEVNAETAAVVTAALNDASDDSASENAAVHEAEVTDYSAFLESIHKKGGTVSSLSWSADEGALSIMTAGLFPEQLTAVFMPVVQTVSDPFPATFGPVAYQAGTPEVPLTLRTCFSGNGSVSVSGRGTAAVLESGPGVAAFRKLIQEADGQLLSETVSPPSLSGSVPESAWVSFAPQFSALLETQPLSSLELSRNDSRISVTIALSDSGLIFPFSDLSCIFGDAPGLPYAPEKEDEWVTAQSEQRGIGRITREDGSSVVFFHSTDGKIERRIYEN